MDIFRYQVMHPLPLAHLRTERCRSRLRPTLKFNSCTYPSVNNESPVITVHQIQPPAPGPNPLDQPTLGKHLPEARVSARSSAAFSISDMPPPAPLEVIFRA